MPNAIPGSRLEKSPNLPHMSNPIHALAQQLTGKPSLDECSLDEIKRIAQRYPYFAPAQFLLLQKLQQSGNTDETEAHHKKAVLFYPDPLQFDVFISSGRFFVNSDQLKNVEPAHDTTAPFLVENDDTGKVGVAETPVLADETQVAPLSVSDPLPESRDVVTGQTLQGKAPDVEALQPETPEPATVAAERNEEATVQAVAEHVATLQETKEEATVVLPPQPVELAFEPFHTVDYFASQGIKISADELPKDKLGKQLKSFTDWLKTMKRLPATQAMEAADGSSEKGVESLASRSITQSDVVTEAMAEVWAKQGAIDKALEIYNKLVLQNPSKRAYFVAKIENLKPS